MGIIGKRTSKGQPVSRGTSHRVAGVLVLLAMSLAFPLSVLALDGRVEVRGTQQDGGAGPTAYETSTLWENYSLGQRILLGKNLVMQLNFVTRRQTLTGRSVLAGSNSETLSLLPNASLSFRSGEFRAGANARGLRKDQSGSNIESYRDEHADFNLWLSQNWSWLELSGNAMRSSSTREAGLNSRETSENSQSASAKLLPTKQDEIRYSFSRNRQDLNTFDTDITYRSHNLRYRGSHGFLENRGRFSLDARTSYLEQTSTFGEDGGIEYRPPVWGGFSLDDTPEEQDPLEDDPIFVPALFDKDRDTPSIINIGDSAPVVRQYGGDYRNLIFDFGDTEPMDQIILYVDTVLRFPELMQWQVFTSDDSDGRDWSNELNASQFSVIWQEMPNERQGWIFSFPATINHRRIKVVNHKLGLTEPNIFVNEMEVYQTLDESGGDLQQTVRRNSLQGDVSYNLTSNLNVNYNTNLTSRHYEETDGDVTGETHRIGAHWLFGSWRLAGSHERGKLNNSSGQESDSKNNRVSLANNYHRKLQTRLSFSQADNRSWSYVNKTQTVSGDLTWRLAPRLTFIQKISYGLRDAISLGVESESWTLGTVIRGRPRPSLLLELRRNDRWVSEEAGADYSTFNTTELKTTWALFPLLTLTSQIIYQVREEDDLVVRNSLVWNPLSGGSVSIRLNAKDFQDTRTNWFQRGGGGHLVWKPRPRLHLEAGIEWVLVKQYDERNSPTNVNFSGSWSF
jgi:hypothetical protein